MSITSSRLAIVGNVAVLALAATALASACSSTPSPTLSFGAKTVLPDGGDPLSPEAMCEELTSGDFSQLALIAPPVPGVPPPPPSAPPTESLRFLLNKAWRLAHVDVEFERDVIKACADLGLAAGLVQRDVTAEPKGGHGAEKVCSNAATKVAEVLKRARDSKINVEIALDPPRCYVGADAARTCLAACGSKPAGDPRTFCLGGELDGVCAGRCSGSCVLPPGPGVGACRGACTGRCDREFRGVCGGNCTGTCDAAAIRGKACSGTCVGSCSDGIGSCGGRCDGSCSGWWDAPSSGSRCPGICVGTCAGEMHDALCTGEYAPKGADPACIAACGAEAAVGLQCDVPPVHAAVRNGKSTAELEQTLAAVQIAVPRILRLQQGGAKRLPHAIEVATAAAIEWSNIYPTAAPHALLCARATVDVMHESAKSLAITAHAMDAILPAIRTEPLTPRPEAD